MRYLKPITMIVLSIFLIASALVWTCAYFTSSAESDPVSITLGDVKLETADSPWQYAPAQIQGAGNLSNDQISGNYSYSQLTALNLRPGDAFEKDIKVIYTGSLDSKLKITKGSLLKASPFKLDIQLVDKASGASITQDKDNADVWYVENVKQKDYLKFKVRLEIPVELTEQQLNCSNIKLDSDAFKLLDIIATQWNNPSFSN